MAQTFTPFKVIYAQFGGQGYGGRPFAQISDGSVVLAGEPGAGAAAYTVIDLSGDVLRTQADYPAGSAIHVHRLVAGTNDTFFAMGFQGPGTPGPIAYNHLSAALAPLGTDTTALPTYTSNYDDPTSAFALKSGGFALAGSLSNGNIGSRAFTASGAPVASDFLVESDRHAQRAAGTQLANGNLAFAYLDVSDTSTNNPSVSTGVFSTAGVRIGGTKSFIQSVSTSDGATGPLIDVNSSPSIAALPGGGYVVLYKFYTLIAPYSPNYHFHIALQYFDKLGAATGSAVLPDPGSAVGQNSYYDDVNSSAVLRATADGGVIVVDKTRDQYNNETYGTNKPNQISVVKYDGSGNLVASGLIDSPFAGNTITLNDAQITSDGEVLVSVSGGVYQDGTELRSELLSIVPSNVGDVVVTATSNADQTLRGTAAAGSTNWMNGAAGNDTFVGSAATNHMVGGTGNDTFDLGSADNVADGGGGSNVAIVPYGKAQATIKPGMTNSWTVGDGTHTDTLTNVQTVQFSDGSQLHSGGDLVGVAHISVSTAQELLDAFNNLGEALNNFAGQVGNTELDFTGNNETVSAQAFVGTTTVRNFSAGDTIDLRRTTGATLTTDSTGAASVGVGSATLNLGSAPANSSFRLYGDAKGGTNILLDSPLPSNAVLYTDVTDNSSHTATGAVYTGPVDYLQSKFILPTTHAAAMSAKTPNVFIKGGPAGDALQVSGGNNVLDGGGGSNFLIGATGADGGIDTFYVDGRGGVETWSTIVNFHRGDQATIFGFHPGLSTMPLTENAGAAGFTGLTLHSELNGPGTGIQASMTFTGIDRATADAHFSFTSGTLGAGTATAVDYLLIQYNR